MAHSQNYENTKVWPHASNQKPDRGAFCGYRSQVVHQGHHIFHYKAYGGEGYYKYNGRDSDLLKREMPHACMAIKGGLARTYVDVKFQMHDGKGKCLKRYLQWCALIRDTNFLQKIPIVPY